MTVLSACHPERSEGSVALGREMLRGVYIERSECAQQDRAVTHMASRINLFIYIIGPRWIFRYVLPHVKIGSSHGMRNEVERMSRGRESRRRAPLDKPAQQRLIYLLLIYLYRIDEAEYFREQR
jgi:hypothetical protein